MQIREGKGTLVDEYVRCAFVRRAPHVSAPRLCDWVSPRTPTLGDWSATRVRATAAILALFSQNIKVIHGINISSLNFNVGVSIVYLFYFSGGFSGGIWTAIFRIPFLTSMFPKRLIYYTSNIIRHFVNTSP